MSTGPSSTTPAVAPGVDTTLREALDALLDFRLAVRTDILEGAGSTDLFGLACDTLRRLMPFRALAVFTLDDDGLGFSLRRAEPAEDAGFVESEVARLQELGTFGWALYQNRPVLVPEPLFAGQTFLHALASRDGVLGVIVGVLPPVVIPEVAQKLAALVALECASALELGAVHRQLSESHRDLEQKVAERTGQLREALAAARAAERAKGVFLANMTHELRTPLNGVIGMTGLLLETRLSPAQRDFVDTVRVSGEHLLHVVDDILDFSKAEDGKLGLESIDFDLRECVESAFELVHERAQRKGLELALNVPAEVPVAVSGDPGRLRQVLINLLGNAVKFTDQGEVVARVTLAGIEDGRGTFRFEVSDTGVGISPDQVARLFEPFQQADLSTSRRFGGTGLGLSICKRIVALMGGEVGLVSTPGQGSTFWFTARLELGVEHREAPPSLRGRRALLVVSHDATRTGVRETLGSLGVASEPCAGLPEALARCVDLAARGLGLDALVVDHTVQGLPAREVVAALRGAPAAAAVPVVVLAPVVEADTVGFTDAVGPATVVFKPVRRTALASRLRSAIGVSSVSPPPTPSLPAPRVADRHVLVVDDNPVNRKVAVALLRRLGCTADTATNGREAVAAVAANRYDVVLMDCHMPEFDGYAAARAIREIEASTRHTPIIALTALATEEDRAQCLDAGMDDYLPKPLVAAALERVVARYGRRSEG